VNPPVSRIYNDKHRFTYLPTMDVQQSPPKRMTRARAAKVGDSSSAAKTTKIVTAAAKAKATRSTSTTAASAKRKTRADEVEDAQDQDDDDELNQPEPVMKTRTRGRPKKAVAEPETEAESAPAPAARTRGRTKKAVAESTKEDPQPAKPTTRATRAKKTPAQPEDEPAPELEKKPATRTRGSATAPTKSTAAKTAGVKKTVKFEEPEKENIAPPVTKATRAKAAAAAAPETTAGLRAKPVRRPAAAATARTSKRAGAKTATASAQESQYEKPTPLSPKKVTQMAMHNRATVTESEDELAADEKTPAKPMPRPLAGPRVRGGFKLQQPSMGNKQTSDDDEVSVAPTIILGSPCRRPPPSPWKESMKTPAKRAEGGVPILSQSAIRPPRHLDGEPGQPPQQISAFKTSLLQSPAKRPQSPVKGLNIVPGSAQQLQFGAPSPFKTSLMSPPKRPLFANKPCFLGFGSPRKQEDETVFGRTPVPKSTLLATPLPAEHSVEEGENEHAGEFEIPEERQDQQESPSRLPFPGRMSAVLPRHADPALDQEESEMEEQQQNEEHVEDYVVLDHHEAAEERLDDPMVLDEPEPPMARDERETTTPPASPPKQTAGFFGLREKDLHPHSDDFESEDEDELGATPAKSVPATPCPPTARALGNLGSTRSVPFGERSTAKRARMDDKFGFTPLVGKLSAWNTSFSPLKTGVPESPGSDILCHNDETHMTPHSMIPVAANSPMRNTYFDEAISSQTTITTQEAPHDSQAGSPVSQPMTAEVLTPEFDDIPLTHEDISLAAEANEMSLLEPAQVEDHLAHEDALSEASQEYGDENAIPIDPTLLVPPVTPARNITGLREFHTVSKVPLKPADESTPRPRIKKRGHSISRLPVQRPTQGMQRNATVISYSPTKQPASSSSLDEKNPTQDRRATSAPPAPTTPAKSDAGWSSAATPARTPRKDLDPALLSGAVVFVDVHTSEGADASGIFVELLAQMGARCVKSWAWNPTSPPAADGGSQSRIGITHVVYKDGGKRTLEKVRESGGVVACVGVSWVLE
jgi:hypothetical protein